MIKFEENLCKTFHGGLCDLKSVPKSIKHISHDIGKKTRSLFVENKSIVECKAEEIDCFYLRPSKQKLAFQKNPAAINALNGTLLCARRLE